jgi:hypothetical protein
MSTEYEAVNPIFCIPPPEIRRLVDNLFSGERSNVESIGADDIPPNVLRRLNTFAATIANVPGCSVLMIHDCPSCYENNNRGNLVDTDSGTQCWKC